MTTSGQVGVEELLDRANRAMADARWSEARDILAQAAKLDESGRVYEDLGWTGWWLGDEKLTIESREKAYELYLEDDEVHSAANVAAWLAGDYSEYRDEELLARGWLKRAHRLIDDLETVEQHGWLALIDCSLLLHLDNDIDSMLDSSRLAQEIGRRFDVLDLVTVGLAYEGLALTGQGAIEEGLAKIDEAASITAVETMALPVSPAWAYCCMLSACDGMGDFSRSRKFCEAMRAQSERLGGRQLTGICRTSYGRILTTGGDWSTAGNELEAAVEDLASSRPAMVPSGRFHLGALRMRQGRIDEARVLFEEAGTYGLLGVGELHLADGEYEEAADIANRVLRNFPKASFTDRLPALELLARASIGLNDPETALATGDTIADGAAKCGTPYCLGRASLVQAEVLEAVGSHDDARIAAEDAIDRFAESSAPYDRARAKFRLALILNRLGRQVKAEEQAERARKVFAALGAKREIEACDALLLGAAAGSDGTISDLTSRELEVLRLVARGMSDAEIAEDLVVSPHTVHRHVANIRTKLRLPSRTAAVAWASEQDLL